MPTSLSLAVSRQMNLTLLASYNRGRLVPPHSAKGQRLRRLLEPPLINPRQAFRSLFKPPLVTAAAILSLALGIGANAAIFSIFERMIMRPLPALDPSRLVNLEAPGPKPGSQSSNTAGNSESVFSHPMFRDLEQAESDFTGIAAHRAFGANLAYAGNTLSGQGMLVSGSYFEVLGLTPALGRLFGPDDDRVPGGHPLVVLSHSYWTHRFGARRDVVDDALVVNGRPMTIVGVAPSGFTGTTLGQDPQVFVPITMRGSMIPGWEGFDNRRSYWAYLFARLRPGVSVEQAAASINVAYKAFIQEIELPLQEGLSDQGLERFRDKEIVLAPGRRGQSVVHQELRAPVLLLMSVTGFVLLIACANVANLLLTKATNRASEIAIRMSIGAQRRQVIAQLLTESLLLATMGGALGLLFAQWTLRFIVSILPAEGPSQFGFEIGPPTWLFLVVLTLVTGLVGLFPALHCTRHDLVVSMRNQSAQSSRSRAATRFRAAMATLQIALSMTLLISAGLFTKSLLNVSRVDLGLELDRVATFGISPDLNNYTPTESRALFERLEDELLALPGVTGVSASLVPLIGNSNWGSNVSVQGFEDGPDVDTHSNFNEVGPAYFRTLGIPLIAGREFERRDTLEAPKVVIVNETFARKFNLGRDAVGKRMQVGAGDELDIEIVGLAQDAKYSEVKRATPPVFFTPYRQDESVGSIYFYVRTQGDPGLVLPTLRGLVSRLDPNLPIEDLRTMLFQVRESVSLDRILTTLSAAFAILATLLASIGLYGVLAYSVAQRRHEIGLRMALGADRSKVRRMIQRQVGWLTVPGALLGIVTALGVGRLARSILFELEGFDLTVFVVATLMLLSVASLAGLLPALRAAQIDPMTALREE